MATIRRRDTKWQAIVRKKGHRSISRTFRTKSAAESWARDTETKIERGTFIDTTAAENTTVADLLAEYERKITPRKRSAAKEESRIRIITRHIGRVSLAGLTPEVVVDFVDDRLERVGSDSVRKELNTLSHAIDTGIALWKIHLAANPVVVARRVLSITKTLGQGVERDRRLQEGELIRLLRASHKPLRALIIWAVESAMRRGEISAMRPEHREGLALRIPETKTDKARTIPMMRHMVRVWGSMPFGMKPDSITHAFTRACDKAGIVDLRFHDLRHEATSRLFEKGLSIQEVASITGHSDWKSLKRYTHPDHVKVGAKLTASRRGYR